MTADQPQRPESREPTTVAGDNLLTDIIQDHEGPSYHVIERIRWGILAIESEARAAERTESGLREALLDIESWTKPIGSPGMDGSYGGQADGRGTIGRIWRLVTRALAADPRPPVPNPDPALAYAPDGSVVGRVIGWATKPDGRSVPILGPAPEHNTSDVGSICCRCQGARAASAGGGWVSPADAPTTAVEPRTAPDSPGMGTDGTGSGGLGTR